jgi:DNA-directed RNA polymerase subunit RPC12/RpoP
MTTPPTPARVEGPLDPLLEKLYRDQLCTNCGCIFDSPERMCPQCGSKSVFGNRYPSISNARVSGAKRTEHGIVGGEL